MRSRGPVKDLKDSKLILNETNESKLFPWSSKISLVLFGTFSGPLFPKPVTGQKLFLAVSYSKPALATNTIVVDCIWLKSFHVYSFHFSEKELPNSFRALERAHVHQSAKSLDLLSKSRGKGQAHNMFSRIFWVWIY